MTTEQYKLDNSWNVWTDGLKYYLDVKPLENSIFRKEETVEITKEIFEEVKAGQCKVSELFKKFNLSKFIIKWGESKSSQMKRENTENKFFGRGFITSKEGSKYFLEYQLARQGGGSRKFQINKEVYEDSRRGNITTSELLKKHNLFHLDNPNNDQ